MPHRWASSWVVTLALLGVAGSCRAAPPGCDDLTNERCLWDQGLRAPIVADKEPGQEDFSGDGNTALSADAKLDHTLTQMVDMMRAGLEWSLVNERARALCTSEIDDDTAAPGDAHRARKAGPPDDENAASDPSGDPPSDGKTSSDDPATSVAWHCDTALLIDTQSLQLEADVGVLSLTAALDETQSADLHERARARFEPWCATTFEELDGTDHLLFYRCALPEGPYLVVARFPHDLDAGEWRVSVAILDAG